MTEIIEATAEVVETNVGGGGELAVTYMPAQITDNLDAISAWVRSQVEPYVGTVIDPSDGKAVKEGRRFMADLNKLKKPIEDERKRIKREYTKPLAAFEARVKAITDEIDAARGSIKEQVDAADEQFKAARQAELEEEYRAIAGPIADVIPYSALAEASWLNRSTKMQKACDELAEKAASALHGYETLREMELAHGQEALKAYCDTLDMGAALDVERELAERDRQMAEFEAAQEAARMEKARRQAEAMAAELQEQRAETEEGAFAPVEMPPVPWGPQPVPARDPWVPQAGPSEPVMGWLLHMEFQGTPALAKQVGQALNALGITGATIKCTGR